MSGAECLDLAIPETALSVLTPKCQRVTFANRSTDLTNGLPADLN